MITKILHIIDATINRIRPQTHSQPCFAKQEEFAFVHDKSKSLFTR